MNINIQSTIIMGDLVFVRMVEYMFKNSYVDNNDERLIVFKIKENKHIPMFCLYKKSNKKYIFDELLASIKIRKLDTDIHIDIDFTDDNPVHSYESVYIILNTQLMFIRYIPEDENGKILEDHFFPVCCSNFYSNYYHF